MHQQAKFVVGWGTLSLNNAGSGQWMPLEETEPDRAVAMMAAPYFAAFFVTRAFLPAMLKRNSGTIVNMTSVACRMAWPGATAYIAARGQSAASTKLLRAELTGTNLRTMLVTFAKVATSYWESNPGSEKWLPEAQSMLRVLTPDEAAQAIIRRIHTRQPGRRPLAAMRLRPQLSLPRRDAANDVQETDGPATGLRLQSWKPTPQQPPKSHPNSAGINGGCGRCSFSRSWWLSG